MTTSESYDISPEGTARIQAVDDYLEEAIRVGRPIEALIATKRLGEITSDRSKEAARAATEGPWSWTDVGKALGVSKQAAHEKLHARVQGHLDDARTKVERAERKAHDKIARRAARGRKKLDRVGPLPKVDTARERIDEWERKKHGKVDRGIRKAQEELARVEQTVQEKLDGKASD